MSNKDIFSFENGCVVYRVLKYFEVDDKVVTKADFTRLGFVKREELLSNCDLHHGEIVLKVVHKTL